MMSSYFWIFEVYIAHKYTIYCVADNLLYYSVQYYVKSSKMRKQDLQLLFSPLTESFLPFIG